MGCNMCAPKRLDNTKSSKHKIRVKDLGNGRHAVTFLPEFKIDEEERDNMFDLGNRGRKDKQSSDVNEMSSTKAGTTTARNHDTNYSQTSISFAKMLSLDDLNTIGDKDVEIRKIGVYTTYYVKAIKIDFESDNLKTISSLHAGPDFDPKNDPKMTYREILLDDGEFVERVNCIKSTQTGFIRSIMFGTNYQRTFLVEGEIELHDINQLDIRDDGYLNDDVEEHSYVLEAFSNHSPSAVSENQLKSRSRKVIIEGDEEESSFDLSKLEIRKASIADFDKKVQNCNLRCINHKLVGLKSSFAPCGYLEDFELYTEEVENDNLKIAEGSPSLSKFVFE